ncbi:DegV family protein [Inconstantimicrobium mannanitabidum]|uniref:DegV domain-containing protein n=1 Tax=Inconstantimicrobium mannanitabidum TaxID=1604901 RepID=A0ACB5RDY9_9CLOT|nr:DegV family protein [Clostridium sp. TW13]GKX67325.1 DegV domain-containing protein [Clostridium sp. TW13]
MQKIALITDSTSGLSQEYLDKYNIELLRLKVIYKSGEYIDGLTITPEQVYSKLDEELPTTSMPSVQDNLDLLNRLVSEGYTHAIFLPISSGLSGTINSMRIAAEEYEDKITSFVYDTKVISMGVGLIVLKVAEMIQEGAEFSYICEQIPKLREKISFYFIVDTLEYLIKGGRIGRVSGRIGEILNLKPIITMGDDGKYTTFTKVRGKKQAISKLQNYGLDILSKGKAKVAVMTGTMFEESEELKKAFSTQANATLLYSGIITPAVGIHCGPRALGIMLLSE